MYLPIGFTLHLSFMGEKYTGENGFLEMRIEEDILHVYYKAGLKLTLESSKDIVKERLKFLDGRVYPMIVFYEDSVCMDKPSRDYFASDEGMQGIKAAAFIKNSAFSRMLVGFFLGMNIPKIKIDARAFTDLNEAVNWLKSLVLNFDKADRQDKLTARIEN